MNHNRQQQKQTHVTKSTNMYQEMYLCKKDFGLFYNLFGTVLCNKCSYVNNKVKWHNVCVQDNHMLLVKTDETDKMCWRYIKHSLLSNAIISFN